MNNRSKLQTTIIFIRLRLMVTFRWEKTYLDRWSKKTEIQTLKTLSEARMCWTFGSIQVFLASNNYYIYVMMRINRKPFLFRQFPNCLAPTLFFSRSPLAPLVYLSNTFGFSRIRRNNIVIIVVRVKLLAWLEFNYLNQFCNNKLLTFAQFSNRFFFRFDKLTLFFCPVMQVTSNQVIQKVNCNDHSLI